MNSFILTYSFFASTRSAYIHFFFLDVSQSTNEAQACINTYMQGSVKFAAILSCIRYTVAMRVVNAASRSVDEEYLKEVERARRHLRALISNNRCAPIMLRLAYALRTISFVYVRVLFL